MHEKVGDRKDLCPPYHQQFTTFQHRIKLYVNVSLPTFNDYVCLRWALYNDYRKAEKLKMSTFLRKRPSRRPAWPLKPNMINDRSPGGAAENVQPGQKATSLSPNWQIRHTAWRCCRPARRGKHQSRHSQLPRTTTGKQSIY